MYRYDAVGPGITAEDAVAAEEADDVLEVLSAFPAAAIPGRDELDTWEIADDQLSYSAALKMNLPVFTVDSSFQSRVLVRDVRRYARREVDGVVGEYGVAVRLVITVFALELEGALTVPVVAAQAELNLVSAHAKMTVLGFRDSKVGELLPSFEKLDIEGLQKYTQAADKIRSYISRNEAAVFPTLLRQVPEPPGPDEEELATGVATARALRLIARRRSQKEALAGIPAGWEVFTTATARTYASITPGAPVDARPDAEAAKRAATWVGWLDFTP